MKILFITLKHYGTIPQGIMYLSSILKKNDFKVDYIDTSKYNVIDTYIKKNKPDLLAYSSGSGDFKYYNDLNKKLKKHRIMSVIGGPHATFFGQKFMREKSISFDGACIGEGEYALLDLCKNIRDKTDYLHVDNWIFKRPNGSVIENKIRPLIKNLDELPFPDFEIDPENYKMKKIVFWLHRGCPSKCTYCMNHKWRDLYKGLGKIIRVPSPWYCIKMIKHRLALTPHNDETILFDDDNFGIDINWLKSFCELYKKEIGIPWESHLYPTLITEDRIKLMADAGCKIIGTAIETGNEERRKNLLKRPMTNLFIQNAIDIIHRYKMGVNIQNILLLPGETFRTAMETFNLNASCKPEVATSSKFQPYPGLELTEKAIEMGYITRGEYENSLPDNIHWISILNFPDKKETKKINNLHHLFSFGTYFTFTKPLVDMLVYLPTNIIHYHFDNVAWQVITHRDDRYMKPDKNIKIKIFFKFVYNFFRISNINYTISKLDMLKTSKLKGDIKYG